jgi:hypothetical protein
MLPPWSVPGPALPELEGVFVLLDFMFAPVVVCDGDDDMECCLALWDLASTANGVAARPVATSAASASWVIFIALNSLS